jgi:hypothetical protein
LISVVQFQCQWKRSCAAGGHCILSEPGDLSFLTQPDPFAAQLFDGIAALRPGGELGSTGQYDVRVARRGWSAGHVKSRPKILSAESNLALAA